MRVTHPRRNSIANNRLDLKRTECNHFYSQSFKRPSDVLPYSGNTLRWCSAMDLRTLNQRTLRIYRNFARTKVCPDSFSHSSACALARRRQRRSKSNELFSISEHSSPLRAILPKAYCSLHKSVRKPLCTMDHREWIEHSQGPLA